jgi:uncharacterized Fe-S cluster-containing radical SAM superfamily enzyme
MEATNESSAKAMSNDEAGLGTKDGETAADNDQPYRFGRKPNARAPYPFTERQYARLLILRGRLQSDDTLEEQAA